MIEIDGDLKCRSGCMVGPVGITGPQLDPSQPCEANRLRILGVQRQMLVAMGNIISFDSAIEIMAGAGQIAPPERAHTKEISTLCSRDRVVALFVEQGAGQCIAIVEAAALEPGEAETTEDRRLHRSVKCAAKRKGPFVELVRTLGAVTLERHKGRSEPDPDTKFERIPVG